MCVCVLATMATMDEVKGMVHTTLQTKGVLNAVKVTCVMVVCLCVRERFGCCGRTDVCLG